MQASIISFSGAFAQLFETGWPSSRVVPVRGPVFTLIPPPGTGPDGFGARIGSQLDSSL